MRWWISPLSSGELNVLLRDEASWRKWVPGAGSEGYALVFGPFLLGPLPVFCWYMLSVKQLCSTELFHGEVLDLELVYYEPNPLKWWAKINIFFSGLNVKVPCRSQAELTSSKGKLWNRICFRPPKSWSIPSPPWGVPFVMEQLPVQFCSSHRNWREARLLYSELLLVSFSTSESRHSVLLQACLCHLPSLVCKNGLAMCNAKFEYEEHFTS